MERQNLDNFSKDFEKLVADNEQSKTKKISVDVYNA